MLIQRSCWRTRDANVMRPRNCWPHHVDPGQQKKQNKIRNALIDAATFEAVAEEYLAQKVREGMADSTQKRLRSQLGFVLPVFGKRPIAEITAPEVLARSRRSRREAAMKAPTDKGTLWRNLSVRDGEWLPS